MSRNPLTLNIPLIMIVPKHILSRKKKYFKALSVAPLRINFNNKIWGFGTYVCPSNIDQFITIATND